MLQGSYKSCTVLSKIIFPKSLLQPKLPKLSSGLCFNLILRKFPVYAIRPGSNKLNANEKSLGKMKYF